MLADVNGHYWVHKAITDTKGQKYLLNVPLYPSDDVIINPPSLWIQADMKKDLVDEKYDAKSNLI